MIEFNLQDCIDHLGRTPRVLESMLTEQSEMWLHSNEEEGSWSAYEIVGHLIYGEITDWMPRLRIILNKGVTQPFEPFDRNGHSEMIKGRSIESLLEQFSELRAKNLEDLNTLQLKEEQLDLKGIHPAFGEVTAQQLLATWLVHDLNHIAQIVRVLGHQYRSEVGPWVEYLRLLNIKKT